MKKRAKKGLNNINLQHLAGPGRLSVDDIRFLKSGDEILRDGNVKCATDLVTLRRKLMMINRALQCVYEACGRGNVQASMWLLERMLPELFSKMRAEGINTEIRTEPQSKFDMVPWDLEAETEELESRDDTTDNRNTDNSNNQTP